MCIRDSKRRETLIENKQKAIISKKLVTLKKDVPVKVPYSDFVLKKIDKKKLYNFLRDMEFNRLLSSAISTYGEVDFKDDRKEFFRAKPETKIDKRKYILIKNENELSELISKIEQESEISIDTETSSLDPHQAELIGISISPKIGEAYYIPLNHKNFKNLMEKNVLKKLQNILEDKSIKKIGQNIKFDYIMLYHRGIDLEPLEDTMLMSYVLDAVSYTHLTLPTICSV